MKNTNKPWIFVVTAALVASCLIGCAQKDTTDLNEEVKATATKAGQNDTPDMTPEEASGDAMMMGGGAKSSGGR
ncbi:MAG: hypothetical protein WD716_00650 [Fimbriimonadaceae bacterium]